MKRCKDCVFMRKRVVHACADYSTANGRNRNWNLGESTTTFFCVTREPYGKPCWNYTRKWWKWWRPR